MRKRLLLLAVAAVAVPSFTGLVGACGPGPGGPVTVGVLGPAETPGEYAIVPTLLPDVESLRRLRGPGVEVRTFSRIVFDYDFLDAKIESGEIETLDDVRDEVVRRKGRSPNAMFARGPLDGVDEVWLAEDFHSLGMATAYAHVSRARSAALDAGMPPTCLQRIPLYYDVTFIEKSGARVVTQKDNAFFMPMLGAIFFLPYEEFRTLSMAMNQGIIAHEYSHAVWSCLVEDFAPWPQRTLSLDEPSVNRISGFNEGVADFFGSWVTGDPAFLAVSMPDESFDRDASVARLLTQAMLDDATDGGDYDPYAIGSVLASALWKIRADSTDPAVAERLVIDALTLLPTELDRALLGSGSFETRDFLAVLAAAAGLEGAAFQGQVCRTLGERFALAGPIPGCP